MATVFDVAAYIVGNSDFMSGIKLQKLVYFSYLEHLKLHDEILFQDNFEAWINGPVVKSLYDAHKIAYIADKSMFEPYSTLSNNEKQSVDLALKKYGSLTGGKLSELSHETTPWINARKGLAPRERSRQVLNIADLRAWARTHA